MKFCFSSIVVLNFIHCYSCLIQGSTVSQAEARFVVSIRRRSTDQINFGNGFLCTATLINNWNVVTAAFCVTRRNPEELLVAMGNVDMTRRSFVADVERIYMHENFTDSFHNNIAVLKLSTYFGQNSKSFNWITTNIQPIELSMKQPDYTESCSFLGWGSNDTLGNNDNLLIATLPVWHENICGSNLNGRFCAGNVNDGPALCYRNLGGPFVCNNQLSGFAIDDSGCGRPGTSGQFHSISHYLEWIHQVSNVSLVVKVSFRLLIASMLVQIHNKSRINTE